MTTSSPPRKSRVSETCALECTCGGLLAEDNNRNVICLRCKAANDEINYVRPGNHGRR